MADWYCSSVAYTAVTQWAALTTLAVGAIRRQLATPTVGQERCFRVSAITTGITGAAEPTWTLTKAGTTTDSGVTWTECSGNSAQQQNGGVTNTWTAPIARVDTALTTFATTNGDRLFVSSDHTQTAAANITFTPAGTASIALSVNRTTGSIPPAPGDIVNGATVITTSNSCQLILAGGGYWQGFTFKCGTGTDTNCLLITANSSNFNYKFVNCVFQMGSTAASGVMLINNAGTSNTWLENCQFNYGNAAQSMQVNAGRVTFVGGSSNPLPGAIPSPWLGSLGSALTELRFYGMDFSSITVGKYVLTPSALLITFANCKFAVNGELFPNLGQTTPNLGISKIDFVNCDAVVGYRNEWYRPAGWVRTSPTAYRNGGASDGLQNISHTFVSDTIATGLLQLEGPPIYMWNTVTGVSKTATIEIAGPVSLNNDDVYVELEYLGASGNPQSTTINNAPATVITTHAAVTTSAATWTSAMEWSPSEHTPVASLSLDGLTATLAPANNIGNVKGDASAYASSGKFYCEFTVLSQGTAAAWRCGLTTASAATTTGLGSDVNLSIGYGGGGIVTRNSGTITTLATFVQGDLICMAVDLTNSKVWWRKGAAGNWNNDVIGNQNPATNTGGVSLSAITGPFVPAWSGGTVANNDAVTANFGESVYSGTAPSGFISWVATPITQKLQISYTAQKAGLLRATVKFTKASSFVRVDPLITIT